MTGFFYFARPIMVPIVVGVTLAFVLSPAVRLLQKLRVPRVLSVILVVFVTLVVFIAVAGLVAAQAGSLVVQLPDYWTSFQKELASWLERFPLLAEYLPKGETGEPLSFLSNIKWNDIASLSKYVFVGIGSALSILGNVILILLITSFILIEWDGFRTKFTHLFGKESAETSRQITAEISRNISGFIIVRFAIAIGLAVFVTIGLLIMGVPYAYVWGPLAGALNLVPYVGSVVSAIPPMIVASIDHGSMWWMLWVALFFLVLQFVEGNVIAPKLIGDKVNLNLTAVMISTLYWGWLWGGVGIILAQPITASIKVICDHVESLRPIGSLLDGKMET
jgi:AI-2 transport protein TqsA